MERGQYRAVFFMIDSLYAEVQDKCNIKVSCTLYSMCNRLLSQIGKNWMKDNK